MVRNLPTSPVDDLSALLRSWIVHLRAERKSPATIAAYRAGVTLFREWCAEQGVPAVLDRPTVRAWIAAMLDGGASANTARSRQAAVRRFSAWLVEEDELDRDELIGLTPPKLDQKVTPRLTEDECRALRKTCAGKDFRDRRDTAIIQFMIETGVRAGEVVAMTVADVNTSRGLAIVRRGKGGRGRPVPFSAEAARDLDRYLRVRAGHRLADTPDLWLGENGRTFRYAGLYAALAARAEDAGIKGFHPHLTRHTAAQRWLDAGGSEGSLMAVAGWRDRAMLDRYTRATASERAADESRGLDLGNFA